MKMSTYIVVEALFHRICSQPLMGGKLALTTLFLAERPEWILTTDMKERWIDLVMSITRGLSK